MRLKELPFASRSHAATAHTSHVAECGAAAHAPHSISQTDRLSTNFGISLLFFLVIFIPSSSPAQFFICVSQDEHIDWTSATHNLYRVSISSRTKVIA